MKQSWMFFLIMMAIAGVLVEAQGAQPISQTAAKKNVKPVQVPKQMSKPTNSPSKTAAVVPANRRTANVLAVPQKPSAIAKTAVVKIPLASPPLPISVVKKKISIKKAPVKQAPVKQIAGLDVPANLAMVQMPTPQPVALRSSNVKSSDILRDFGPMTVKIWSGKKFLASGFALSSQMVATLFQNVTPVWNNPKDLSIEVLGQKIPADVVSVDVQNNLALLKPQTNLRYFFDRAVGAQKSVCLFGLGFAADHSLVMSSQNFERSQWGGPCFDEQGQFVGLLSQQHAQAVRSGTYLGLLLLNASKLPAQTSFVWKQQSLLQLQGMQSQALTRFSNQISNGNCESSNAQFDVGDWSAWRSQVCSFESVPWSDSRRVLQVSWETFQGLPVQETNASNAIQPLAIFTDWKKSLPAIAHPKCHKTVVMTNLGVADLHLCSQKFEEDSEFLNTFAQWTIRSPSQPFRAAIQMAGVNSATTKSLIEKMSQSLRRAE